MGLNFSVISGRDRPFLYGLDVLSSLYEGKSGLFTNFNNLFVSSAMYVIKVYKGWHIMSFIPCQVLIVEVHW